MPKVVQPSYSIQYDGTNGAHIAGTWCTGVTFVSDTGTELTFIGDGYTRTMQVGDWGVIWGTESNEIMIFTPQEYANRYYELP